MTKIYFSVFPAHSSSRDPVKYRKYTGKGQDGKPSFEEVDADYRVTSPDGTISGSGIKDRSRAGNPVIRLNFGVKAENSVVYYNATLNNSGNKKNPNGPDMFGTAISKGKGGEEEYDLACWFKQDKNGNRYLSCSMQEPYRKSSSSDDQRTADVVEEDDDIPF